jgi:hypothetical protein
MKKKLYLVFLAVILMFVFGGCGGSGGGGGGGKYYPFIVLDGVWEITSASGSFNTPYGRFSLALNRNSPVNGLIFDYDGENKSDTTGYFIIQGYSEYIITGPNGYKEILERDDSIPVDITVTRESNRTFKFYTEDSTITIKCINDDNAEVIEEGTVYIDGYAYNLSLRYTIVRR